MRFLSEVEPQRADAFEAIMDGLPHAEIGEVTDAARLEIHADTVPVISADLATLKEAWQRPLRW